MGTADDVPIVSPATHDAQHTQLTDEFASVGLIFTPSPAVEDINEVVGGAGDHFLMSAYQPSGNYRISGHFIVPVRSLGMNLVGPSTALLVYGSRIEDVMDVPSDANVDGKFVSVNTPFDITSFTVIDDPDRSYGLYVNNLTYTVVPEPGSSLILLTTSASGLTMRRRPISARRTRELSKRG